MSISNPDASAWSESRLGKNVLLTFEDGGDLAHPSPHPP